MPVFDCGPLLNLLSTYAVGFTVPDGRGHFDFLGSGTLVDIAGTRGIITARHVLNEISAKGEVRIALFRNSDIGQFPILDLSHTDRVTLATADLGFLSLPAPFVSTLTAMKTFRPLVSDEVKQPSLPQLAFLVGAPDEWTTNERLSNRQRRQFSLLGTKGKFIENGFPKGTIVTLEPQFGEDHTAPNSYGGVSGGAAWLCFLTNDLSDVVERRLVGVAYAQRKLSSGVVAIDCAGPEFIYGELLDAVIAQFGTRALTA